MSENKKGKITVEILVFGDGRGIFNFDFSNVTDAEKRDCLEIMKGYVDDPDAPVEELN
jgi:hypothetical protein